jgi:hypothetical protein
MTSTPAGTYTLTCASGPAQLVVRLFVFVMPRQLFGTHLLSSVTGPAPFSPWKGDKEDVSSRSGVGGLRYREHLSNLNLKT